MYKLRTIILIITFGVRTIAVPVPALGSTPSIPSGPSIPAISSGLQQQDGYGYLASSTFNAGPISTIVKGLEDAAGFLFGGAATLATGIKNGIAHLGTGLAGTLGADPNIMKVGQKVIGQQMGQQGAQRIPFLPAQGTSTMLNSLAKASETASMPATPPMPTLPVMPAITALPGIQAISAEPQQNEPQIGHLDSPILNAGPFSTALKGLEDTAGFLINGVATFFAGIGNGIAHLGTGLAGTLGSDPNIMKIGQKVIGQQIRQQIDQGIGQGGVQFNPILPAPPVKVKGAPAPSLTPSLPSALTQITAPAPPVTSSPPPALTHTTAPSPPLTSSPPPALPHTKAPAPSSTPFLAPALKHMTPPALPLTPFTASAMKPTARAPAEEITASTSLATADATSGAAFSSSAASSASAIKVPNVFQIPSYKSEKSDDSDSK